jgi:hypothetical protein
MPYSRENLVYLVWEESIGSRSFTRVVSNPPPNLEVDLEKGTWTIKDSLPNDPVLGKSLLIGGTEFRNIANWTLRRGPIGVFDRTNLDHLDNLVSVVEANSLNAYGPLLRRA